MASSEVAKCRPSWSPDGKKVAFVLANPTLSVLLLEQIGQTDELSLAIGILYVLFIPSLVLA